MRVTQLNKYKGYIRKVTETKTYYETNYTDGYSGSRSNFDPRKTKRHQVGENEIKTLEPWREMSDAETAIHSAPDRNEDEE